MVKPNYDKINFTRMMGEFSGDCNNHGDCFHYGSFGGCDENCPQLLRGDCECDYEDIKDITDRAVDITEEEAEEILSLYEVIR